MTAPTPRRAAIDDRDFKTVQGLVTEGQRLNEAIANMVAAAYEEVDGRNRPRGSAMGRLLHDVNGKIGQFWTVLELIKHRHADEMAAVTAERDQARQMLADAPHGPHCSSLIPVPDPPRYGCDCWKVGL